MGTSPLLSFLKEVFFSKEAIQQTVKRNKLVTLLIFSHICLFILLLFRTEQAIKREESYAKLKQAHAELSLKLKPIDHLQAENERLTHLHADVSNQLSFLQYDYNELNRSLSDCMSQKSVCTAVKPIANKKHTIKKDPAYVQNLNQQLKD